MSGWHPESGRQPVAAVTSAYRFDRDVEIQQVLDAAAHGALVQVKALGQLQSGVGAAARKISRRASTRTVGRGVDQDSSRNRAEPARYCS
jgi:hypothetical protein